MATTTVLVTQLTGQAWVRGKNGALIPIRQGIAMPVGLRIVTAPNSTIQLQVEGMPPLTLCENTDITLTEDLFAPVDFSEAGTDADINALLQALAQESESASVAPAATLQSATPAPVPAAPSASVAHAPAIPALEVEDTLTPPEPAPVQDKPRPEPVELSMADAIAPLQAIPVQEDDVLSVPAQAEDPFADAANDPDADAANLIAADPAFAAADTTPHLPAEASVSTSTSTSTGAGESTETQTESVPMLSPEIEPLQDDAAFELATTDAAFAPNEPMDALQTMQALEAAAAAEAAEAAISTTQKQNEQQEQDLAAAWASDAAFAPNEPMDSLQTMQALEKAEAQAAIEQQQASVTEPDISTEAAATVSVQEPVAEIVHDGDLEGLSPELMEALQQAEAADEQASAAMLPLENLPTMDDSDTAIPHVLDAGGHSDYVEDIAAQLQEQALAAPVEEPEPVWGSTASDSADGATVVAEATPTITSDLNLGSVPLEGDLSSTLQMTDDIVVPSVDDVLPEPADAVMLSASTTDDAQERYAENYALGDAGDTMELIDAEGNTLTPVDMAEVPNDVLSEEDSIAVEDDATVSSHDDDGESVGVNCADEAMDLNLDLMIPANPATPMALVESVENATVMLTKHAPSTTDVEPMTAERVDTDDTQENQKSQVKVSGGGLVTEGTDIEFTVTLADGSAQDLVVSLKISANRPK